MSLGDYDEDEHERRERKTSSVDAYFDQERPEYEGSVSDDTEASADDLLEQFAELQDE